MTTWAISSTERAHCSVSQLTSTTRSCAIFDLPQYKRVKRLVEKWSNPQIRSVVTSTEVQRLTEPIIYIQNSYRQATAFPLLSQLARY